MVMGGLLVMSLPTAIVMAVALLPAGAAFMIDRSVGRHAAWCVGATNVAGLYPFLLELWNQGHTIPGAVALLSNVLVMLAIYVAAAVGWLIFLGVPQLTMTIVQARREKQIAELRAHQEQLTEQWGHDLALQTSR
jgi:hypothetical protein